MASPGQCLLVTKISQVMLAYFFSTESSSKTEATETVHESVITTLFQVPLLALLSHSLSSLFIPFFPNVFFRYSIHSNPDIFLSFFFALPFIHIFPSQILLSFLPSSILSWHATNAAVTCFVLLLFCAFCVYNSSPDHGHRLGKGQVILLAWSKLYRGMVPSITFWQLISFS